MAIATTPDHFVDLLDDAPEIWQAGLRYHIQHHLLYCLLNDPINGPVSFLASAKANGSNTV
jgi:hypothetical protein